MSIARLDGLNAYGRSASLLPATTPAAAASAPSEGEGFGDMIGDMAGSMANALGKAEQAAVAQAGGKGDLVDLVTAIGAAEQALDSFVAVRDKVVSAYGDIMRMQI